MAVMDRIAGKSGSHRGRAPRIFMAGHIGDRRPRRAEQIPSHQQDILRVSRPASADTVGLQPAPRRRRGAHFLFGRNARHIRYAGGRARVGRYDREHHAVRPQQAEPPGRHQPLYVLPGELHTQRRDELAHATNVIDMLYTAVVSNEYETVKE